MRGNHRSPALGLCIVVAILLIALLTFSQTVAWFGDEGYHLLAAQLIIRGKRPYLDFFYQHTPLSAYINAGWMRVFGESWRSAHTLSALLTGATSALVAGHVYSRLEDSRWRLAGAITAALLLGLNFLVIQFGTIGQPYALCLFFSIAAFRFVTEAIARPGGLLTFWGGACASAAALSSLLAAPVAPILLLWMVRYDRAGGRRKKCAQFIGGASLAMLPLAGLAAQAPHRVFFNVVGYHLSYRLPGSSTWDLTLNNLRVLAEWLNSTQALLLLFLAGVGLLFVSQRGEVDVRERPEYYLRAECYLCAWLAVGLGIYLATPRPTYAQYFILLTPFLSILASVGVYAIGKRVRPSVRPGWLALPVVLLFLVGMAKSAYEQRRYLHSYWRDIETLALEVNRVTPRDGLVYANEAIYFAARRSPPPGLENSFAIENLPPALAAISHAAPQSQIDELLAAGYFDTVILDIDDPKVERFNLSGIYAESEKIQLYDSSYCLFWKR